MNLSHIIKDSCKELHVSLAELSRRMNQSPQNLGKKLNNETLSFDEFLQMCACLGIKYEQTVTLPNQKVSPSSSLNNERYREKIAILVSEIELQKRNIEYLQRCNRDVRTSLNSISVSSEIALRNLNDIEKVKTNLEMIERIDAQVSDLLNQASGIKSTTLLRPEEHNEVISIRGKRGLIVEDDKLNRELLTDLLLDSGVTCDAAENGVEAVNMIKANSQGYYDFILMDIIMPEMNGFEATQTIRALGETCPIIALSADTDERNMTKGVASGMNDYIVKPTSGDMLFFTIMKNLITK